MRLRRGWLRTSARVRVFNLNLYFGESVVDDAKTGEVLVWFKSMLLYVRKIIEKGFCGSLGACGELVGWGTGMALLSMCCGSYGCKYVYQP